MNKAALSLTVKIRRLSHAQGLPLPAYQTADAAGMDLIAAVPADTPVTLQPGNRALVPTGLVFELPKGSEAQVRPRSGLAAKHGVTVLNSPGTIDADYRGEVSVILINHGDAAFIIQRGDRIAQMIIASVVQPRVVETKTVTETARGSGGFGSTGIAASKPKKISPKSTAVALSASDLKSDTRKARQAKSRTSPRR